MNELQGAACEELNPSDGFVGSIFAERYKILSLLGAGGMGTVYKARDLERDYLVAIKILRQKSDPAALRRFQQEGKALSKLTHAHVVRVNSFGIIPCPHLVMQYIEGISLAELLEQKGPLPEDQAVSIFKQICSGLSAVHEAGIVHRDLKPGNVVLQAERYEVKLVDFGIARVNDVDAQKLTQPGALLGSFSYMSPEQSHAGEIDARADIYSLGCLMYETVTGRVPFSADTPLEMLARKLSEQPEPLGKAISASLGQVIMKTLSKSPDQRFQSVAELMEALENPTALSPGVKQPGWFERQNVNRLRLAALAGLMALSVVAYCFCVLPQKENIRTLGEKSTPRNYTTLHPLFHRAMAKGDYANAEKYLQQEIDDCPFLCLDDAFMLPAAFLRNHDPIKTQQWVGKVDSLVDSFDERHLLPAGQMESARVQQSKMHAEFAIAARNDALARSIVDGLCAHRTVARQDLVPVLIMLMDAAINSHQLPLAEYLLSRSNQFVVSSDDGTYNRAAVAAEQVVLELAKHNRSNARKWCEVAANLAKKCSEENACIIYTKLGSNYPPKYAQDKDPGDARFIIRLLKSGNEMLKNPGSCPTLENSGAAYLRSRMNLSMGRCYLYLGDITQARDCFVEAQSVAATEKENNSDAAAAYDVAKSQLEELSAASKEH